MAVIYRATYERGNVTGSYDMTQEHVETVWKGSAFQAFWDVAPEDMHDVRLVSVERMSYAPVPIHPDYPGQTLSRKIDAAFRRFG